MHLLVPGISSSSTWRLQIFWVCVHAFSGFWLHFVHPAPSLLVLERWRIIKVSWYMLETWRLWLSRDVSKSERPLFKFSTTYIKQWSYISYKWRDISSRTCLMLFFSHSYTSSLWLRSHISKNWRYRSNQITSNKPTNQTTRQPPQTKQILNLR